MATLTRMPGSFPVLLSIMSLWSFSSLLFTPGRRRRPLVISIHSYIITPWGAFKPTSDRKDWTRLRRKGQKGPKRLKRLILHRRTVATKSCIPTINHKSSTTRVSNSVTVQTRPHAQSAGAGRPVRQTEHRPGKPDVRHFEGNRNQGHQRCPRQLGKHADRLQPLFAHAGQRNGRRTILLPCDCMNSIVRRLPDSTPSAKASSTPTRQFVQTSLLA